MPDFYIKIILSYFDKEIMKLIINTKFEMTVTLLILNLSSILKHQNYLQNY